MGLIKEPLDVDFYVDPRPLTEEEERLLSAFFRRQRQCKTSHTPSPVKRVALRKKKELA